MAINLLYIPKFIVLTDSNFAKAGKVDMLLGAELFWNLLDRDQRKFGPGKPLLQKTQLGWIQQDDNGTEKFRIN